MKGSSVLIKNASWVVTQNPRREILKNISIYIEEGKIIEIGKPKVEADYILEGKDKIILPSLINCHTHSPMTLLRGYSDDKDLEEWWFKDIYPIESKFKPKHVYVGALLACVEMIKFGCTYFVDFYYFLDEIAKAVLETGLRCNLGQGILDFKTFEFPKKELAFLIARRAIKKWKGNERVKISIAPHMFQTTSPDTYAKCAELTRKYNILLQTHLCETRAEVEYTKKKYGKKPVELLEKCGCLHEKTIVAHCNYLSKAEIRKLAEYDVKIAHCPISNMKLASGIMPIKEMLKNDLTIGLGTDGCASNNNLDLFEEMKVCSLIHKVNLLDPSFLRAQEILDMVTINAAKVVHEKELGSIEEGKKADLILIDTKKPHLQPIHRKSTVISNLVYSAKGQDVCDVICDGKILMRDRKLLTVDEDEIYEKVNKIVEELMK